MGVAALQREASKAFCVLEANAINSRAEFWVEGKGLEPELSHIYIYIHTHTPFAFTNPLNISRCWASSHIWPGGTKHDPVSKSLIGKSYSQLASFEVLLLKATRWRFITQKKHFKGKHPKLPFSSASTEVVL
ncbi:UNVERIFIED_CONTAM: hypothetical protein K2H54_035964 [Gekko kuhli]